MLAEEEDYLRPLVGLVVQEVLEAEMSEVLGAQKGERTGGRMGYRSGYYVRNLVTRVGRLELRVPQDRQGRFSTQLFERYQRSEKALVAALGGDVRARGGFEPDDCCHQHRTPAWQGQFPNVLHRRPQTVGS